MNNNLAISIQERENTIEILRKDLGYLSRLFRECYLQKGRGAIILYPLLSDNIRHLSCIAYNTKDESVDLFDNKRSREDLKKRINEYDPKKQGILVLITKSNATWFLTVRLKSGKP